MRNHTIYATKNPFLVKSSDSVAYIFELNGIYLNSTATSSTSVHISTAQPRYLYPQWPGEGTPQVLDDASIGSIRALGNRALILSRQKVSLLRQCGEKPLA